MNLRSAPQTFSRRLLGYFLLFGLTSVIALVLGVISFERFVREDCQDQQLLGRIQEVRGLLLADRKQRGGVGAQALVTLLGSEDDVAYAAIVSPDGKFSAHTKRSQVGQPGNHDLLQGSADSLIERKIRSNDGQTIREYWAPLRAGDNSMGCLQVGVIHSGERSWLCHMGDSLPMACMGPLSVMLIGVFVLWREARTNAVIESQLCAVSASNSPTDFRLQPLTSGGPAAEGWNRLVEQAAGRRTASSLEASLNRSLNGMQERRTERLLNALPEGVALTDKDGKISYANRSFSILLQQPSNLDLRGKTMPELFPAGAKLQLETTHLTRPVVFEVQFSQNPTDGVLRVGRNPLAGDEQPTALQHVWTVSDITQQKLAEEMRNQFVFAATHELRTPLANIKAYAETLSMHEITDPEQQKGFLNTINSEATRLARFVEELLNISQLEAGSLALSRQEVDLERLLNEVADKVRPQMLQKHISFDTQLPVKLPKLNVDKDKFTSALVNLLGNAAKYTPDNGHITFKTVIGQKDVQISVEDTGIGISREEMPKLFTKFFRSSDERVRDIPGSGLGLSFTQEVARLHGGKLLVHSELNKGSQFTMIVPA